MWHDTHNSILILTNCEDCRKYSFLNAGSKVSFCTFALDGIIYEFFILAKVWAWEDVPKKCNGAVPALWDGVWVESCLVQYEPCLGEGDFDSEMDFHKNSRTFHPGVVFFSHTEALQQTIEGNVTVKSRLQEYIINESVSWIWHSNLYSLQCNSSCFIWNCLRWAVLEDSE